MESLKNLDSSKLLINMRKYRTIASEYARITGSERYGRAKRTAIKRGNYGAGQHERRVRD